MITINGKTAEELGFRVLADWNEVSLPSTRDRVVSIPGRDGAYDFGADLDVRPFDFPCMLVPQADEGAKRLQIRELVRTFTDQRGKPKTVTLVFDAEPDKAYDVRYSGAIRFEHLLRKFGKFPLQLTAFDPYAKSTVSTEDITMDSDTSVLSDVLLDAQYEFNVTSPQTVEVHNFGYYDARPTIELSGSWSSLTLTANGQSATVGAHTGTVVLRGDNYTVLVDGQSSFSAMTGDFIELYEGYNDVQIDGTGLNVTITFKFKPKYL